MKELLQALAQFNKQVLPIVKGANNPFFKSKFADLTTIQQTIKTPLADNKLVITQANVWLDGHMFVETRVWHTETGNYINSVFPVIVNKQSAQDYGSAVSYAKRYSLSGLLNLVIQDEDDDAEKATDRKPKDEVGQDKRLYLLTLLEAKDYADNIKDKLALKIENMTTMIQYNEALKSLK
jgi:hypothetical protein